MEIKFLILGAVLALILSPENCKTGLPTVDNLLHNPFFSSIILTLHPGDRAHLKIPTSTKERLKTNQLQLEERLKEEQKMVRSQKRLVRVQEMMSSEEEKKKQRQKKVQFYEINVFEIFNVFCFCRNRNKNNWPKSSCIEKNTAALIMARMVQMAKVAIVLTVPVLLLRLVLQLHRLYQVIN